MRLTGRRSAIRGVVAAAATVVMVVAFPVVVWYLVGDLSTAPPGTTPDYDVRPPSLSAGTTAVIGMSGIVTFLVGILGWWCAGRVESARRSGSMNRSVVFLALLLPAGAIVAFAWRVMTAGTIGAGGAGFAEMFLFPVAAILFVIAVVYGARCLLSR